MLDQNVLTDTRAGEAKRRGGHALVIGGSMAGLLAARVLADHFDRVTIVERDAYPETAAARKGVPQAGHVHALLRRGQLNIERLFPGLRAEMTAAGDGTDARAEEFLRADFVVDAAGRGSRAPRWLAELGYPAPAEIVVDSFRGYASRLYRLPDDFTADWRCVFVQGAPPDGTRGGILFPVEGGRWLLTLIGAARDYPPADEAGFLDYARSLRSPVIYEAIRDAEPLSPISTFRATENRLRLFERTARAPENFVAVGDSVCAFNPVYGQGMTVASMGAMALDETLRERRSLRGEGALDGLARRFQRRLARVNSAPWMLATSEDYRYRETVGGRPSAVTRFMHGYMDRVVRLATHDARVRRRLLESFHMLRRPASLFSPFVVRRVLAHLFSSRPAARAHASAGGRRVHAFEAAARD